MTSTKKSAVEAFKTVTDHFAKIKIAYDEGANPIAELYEMGVASAFALAEHASVRSQGSLEGATPGTTKVYDVFLTKDGKRASRPVRQDLYLKNPNVFKRAWADFVASIDKKKRVASSASTNAAIYTCLCAVACAYDLFKPGSRKTPGTFFEVLAGAVIGEVANLQRGKQVALPDSKYKVPTDIVLINDRGPHLVIPTKITTRERIVQVWAQQRILQDVFGLGKYLSVLVSMSELQRDDDEAVNEICVPGQVGLFQKYLANVSGMYYLDIPKAYGTGDISRLVKVGDFGQLLGGDLSKLLNGGL